MTFPAEEVFKHPALEDFVLERQGTAFEIDLEGFVEHMNSCTDIASIQKVAHDKYHLLPCHGSHTVRCIFAYLTTWG